MNREMRRKLNGLAGKGLDKILGHISKGSISKERVDELIASTAKDHGHGTGKADLIKELLELRIPTKLGSDSTGSWTRIPEQAGQSARSDAGCWGFTRVMSLGSSCRAWA